MNIRDIARALHKRNHGLEYRLAALASSAGELSKKIDRLMKSEDGPEDSGCYLSSDQSLMESIAANPPNDNNPKHLLKRWAVGQPVELERLLPAKGSNWADLPKYAFDHNTEFYPERITESAGRTVDSEDEFYLNILKKLSENSISKDTAMQTLQLGLEIGEENE